MNVTGVRIHLEKHFELKAYATVELDGEFVVRQVKVIQKNGKLSVYFPSRKQTTPCPKCRHPVPITDEFCGRCSEDQGPQEPRLEELRNWLRLEPSERLSVHMEVAHPVTKECRQEIERVVLEAYRRELAHRRDTQAVAGGAVASARPGGDHDQEGGRAASGAERLPGDGQD